jgi:O-antigen/teichoic acid export membrane protein
MAIDVSCRGSMTETLPRAGVARNVALLTLATAAARACGFGLAIALGRGLGAEDYGRYAFAAAVVTVIAPLADLGLTPYLLREVAGRGGGAVALTRRCVHVKLVSSALTLAGLSAAALVLEGDAEMRLALVALGAGAMLDSLSQFVYAWLQGAERMGYEATATTAAAFVRSLGGIAFVVAGTGLGGVVAWIAAVAAVQAAWAGLRLRRLLTALGDPGSPAAGRINWGSVLAMGLVTVFTMVYLRADSVLLGWMRDATAVGWYTSAYTVTGTLQILPWMLAVGLAPVFARTHGRDPAAFAAAWNDGLRIVTIVAVPLALLTSLLADAIVRLLYGARFLPGGPALAVLVWSTPVWAWNMLVSGALRGAKQERLLTIVTGAGAVVNVAVNLWAIPRFGLQGAAAVTVATEALVLLTLATRAIATGVISVPRLPVGRLLGALALLAVLTVSLRDAAWVVAAVMGTAAYVLALVATRVVGRADLQRIRRALVRT